LVRPFGRKTQSQVRAWVWLLPCLGLMGVILFYPLISTVWMSLSSADNLNFVGLKNYVWALGTPEVLQTIANSLLWIVILPIVALIIGVIFAVLTDRVKYERLAKGIIMIPSAMSLVVGGVIWTLAFRYNPPGTPQTGLLNAILSLIPGAQPVAWTISSAINNFALMFIGLWTWLGLATVLISAGLKGISADLIEAARLDGSNEWQVFRYITLPQLAPTLLMVFTTLVIWALKAFDIVYVMTGGRYGTDVLAMKVYTEFFVEQQLGHGSALAVILFVLAIPVMAVNVSRSRREENN